MRLRAVLVLVVLTGVLYQLAPRERKQALRDRLRELGRALVISIVIYWIWLLGSAALRG